MSVFLQADSYLLFLCIGIKRKVHKESDLPTQILTMLAKLDEEADARMEDRERKRMLLEAEFEEKQHEEEWRYEELMQTMLFSECNDGSVRPVLTHI